MKTACVQMTGPDAQMDQVGDNSEPANQLPVKCPHCTFPDIDFIPKPYLLVKGISSPSEILPAVLGNFLVRERVKRILETVVPKACSFHPTAERKTRKAAPWFLAVPTSLLKTPMPKAEPPFCSRCRESKLGQSFASLWAKMKEFDTRGVDIFRTAEWGCLGTLEDGFQQTNDYRMKKCGLEPLPWSERGVPPPPHPERWTRREIDRDLYFSKRLEQLLKRLKVKGQLVGYTGFDDVQLTPQDEQWIEEKLNLLAKRGLADRPKPAAAKGSMGSRRWFQKFLAKHGGKKPRKIDFASIEKRHKLTLPEDYKNFISAFGQKIFNNVNGTDGFKATILSPQKLDFRDYRRGRVRHLEGEQAKIDGVMFSTTGHGDCFVFDVAAEQGDYPVFWYEHEQNTMHPFAQNFVECLRRFVECD